MNEQSLINLGELSKPATVLIEKISEAVGGVFKPFQIVRVAKAEVEADLIRAEGQIQTTDLHRRAAHRFLEEEAKKQLNIEHITQLALPQLEETSNPGKVETDWITNFFDKCRIVSDEDMQALWSGVLAGEANLPGAFSKRTVNLLGDLDKVDAELFTRLCGFVWNIGYPVVIVFEPGETIYRKYGITFDVLSHLESLGLVQLASQGFQRTSLPKTTRVSYFGKPLDLALPKNTDNSVSIGKAILTKAGRELAGICNSRPVDGFFDFVYDEWARTSLVPQRGTK